MKCFFFRIPKEDFPGVLGVSAVKNTYENQEMWGD